LDGSALVGFSLMSGMPIYCCSVSITNADDDLLNNKACTNLTLATMELGILIQTNINNATINTT